MGRKGFSLLVALGGLVVLIIGTFAGYPDMVAVPLMLGGGAAIVMGLELLSSK